MTMKRILAMLLTLLMIVAVFAGCAGSGEVSEQSSTPAESSKTEESKADESSEPSGDTSDGPVYEGSTDPITFKLLMTSWQTWSPRAFRVSHCFQSSLWVSNMSPER